MEVLPKFGERVPDPVKTFIQQNKEIIGAYWKDGLISPGTENKLRASIPWLPPRTPIILMEDE